MQKEEIEIITEGIGEAVKLAEQNVLTNLKLFTQSILDNNLLEKLTTKQLLELFIHWLNLSLKDESNNN